MATSTFFESTSHQQINEIIVTLNGKYLNFKNMYFKVGTHKTFVALPLCLITVTTLDEQTLIMNIFMKTKSQ